MVKNFSYAFIWFCISLSNITDLGDIRLHFSSNNGSFTLLKRGILTSFRLALVYQPALDFPIVQYSLNICQDFD